MKLLTTFLLTIGFATVLWAQPKLSAGLLEANNFLKANDFAAAEAVIQKELKEKPKDGLSWMFLGRTHYFAKQYDKAISAFAQASLLAYAPDLNEYNIAACHALSKREDETFVHLQKALDANFADFDKLQNDSDFDLIGRNTPRFKTFVDKVKKVTRPCEYDDRYRALDFWLGDWDVINQDGVKIATNTIELAHNDCVLIENWDPVYNTIQGKSYNYFDAANDTWHQHWVGQAGIVGSTVGVVEDSGAIVFHGATSVVNGNSYPSRMTLAGTSDGGVLQRFENEIDGQWVTQSENIYVRSKVKQVATN